MNKQEYPFWLKLAMRLPLRWKHWIRLQAEMTEYWSNKLVLEDSESLLELIENRKEPDFEEFDRQLNLARSAWGKHDSWLEGMAVRRRLLEFRREYHKPESNP